MTPNPEPDAPHGLHLCDDLIFASRVGGTARALGLTVRQVRSVDALVELVRRHGVGGVLVDLSFPGLDLPDLLRRLSATDGGPPRVLAYGSHVDTATLRAARAAGCDPVLPRSAFVEQLAAALPAWLGVPPAQIEPSAR